jgi:hypothetical protein
VSSPSTGCPTLAEVHADLVRAPGVEVRAQQVAGVEAREPDEVGARAFPVLTIAMRVRSRGSRPMGRSTGERVAREVAPSTRSRTGA